MLSCCCIAKKIKIYTALLLSLTPFMGLQANELSQIQQQIKQTEQQIAQQRQQQRQLQSNLKNHETHINQVVNRLRQTETELKESNRLITETSQQIKQLEQQQQQQKQKLAKQLDSAYRAGTNPALLEKLLSEKAQNAERMKAYYEHINKVRLELIEDLKQTQTQLAENKRFIEQQRQQQQQQLSQQQQQQRELQQAQAERQKTLNQLNRSLQQDENRLATLKANENALKQQIQRAEKAAREQEKQEREAYAQKKAEAERKNNKPYQPTAQEQQLLRSGSGLGQARKQYAMPVSGKILHRFGATQMGELKWKGLVIAANTGSSVKAIADGRVILANWLQGYGLVVVIDHGKGDMSLYGYNQALSVKEGSLVRAGQKIAEVGNSGGQGRSSLYFEIRRQGNAINPIGWLK